MEGRVTPLPWWLWRAGLMESWISPLIELGFADMVMVEELYTWSSSVYNMFDG